MKVFSTPIPAPKYDWQADYKELMRQESAHQEQVAAWLRCNGYGGPLTGKTVGFGVCDGTALYMYGDAGAKSILIHLPYGDAYQYRDIKFLPRKEIERRLR